MNYCAPRKSASDDVFCLVWSVFYFISFFVLNQFTPAPNATTLGKGVDICIGKLNFGRELKPPAIVVASELNVEKEGVELVQARSQFSFVFIQKFGGWISLRSLMQCLSIIHNELNVT